MQRDTTGLTTENKELKLRLQAMEQQAQLREGNMFSSVLLIIWGLGRRELVELFHVGFMYLEFEV